MYSNNNNKQLPRPQRTRSLEVTSATLYPENEFSPEFIPHGGGNIHHVNKSWDNTDYSKMYSETPLVRALSGSQASLDPAAHPPLPSNPTFPFFSANTLNNNVNVPFLDSSNTNNININNNNNNMINNTSSTQRIMQARGMLERSVSFGSNWQNSYSPHELKKANIPLPVRNTGMYFPPNSYHSMSPQSSNGGSVGSVQCNNPSEKQLGRFDRSLSMYAGDAPSINEANRGMGMVFPPSQAWDMNAMMKAGHEGKNEDQFYKRDDFPLDFMNQVNGMGNQVNCIDPQRMNSGGLLARTSSAPPLGFLTKTVNGSEASRNLYANDGNNVIERTNDSPNHPPSHHHPVMHLSQNVDEGSNDHENNFPATAFSPQTSSRPPPSPNSNSTMHRRRLSRTSSCPPLSDLLELQEHSDGEESVDHEGGGSGPEDGKSYSTLKATRKKRKKPLPLSSVNPSFNASTPSSSSKMPVDSSKDTDQNDDEEDEEDDDDDTHSHAGEGEDNNDNNNSNNNTSSFNGITSPTEKSEKGEQGEKGEKKEKGEKAEKGKGKNSETSKSDPPKDYIHVRARRGQATDSHSLAERVRREKISERMKVLQDLVPTCTKVTGKAAMLDEIINYVRSLQMQVELLSSKLAAIGHDIPPIEEREQATSSETSLSFIQMQQKQHLDLLQQKKQQQQQQQQQNRMLNPQEIMQQQQQQLQQQKQLQALQKQLAAQQLTAASYSQQQQQQHSNQSQNQNQSQQLQQLQQLQQQQQLQQLQQQQQQQHIMQHQQQKQQQKNALMHISLDNAAGNSNNNNQSLHDMLTGGSMRSSGMDGMNYDTFSANQDVQSGNWEEDLRNIVNMSLLGNVKNEHSDNIHSALNNLTYVKKET